MSKVHIALVGSQAIPVYVGVKSVQPDFVYFIYSSQTENVADILVRECRVANKKIAFHPSELLAINSSLSLLDAEIPVDADLSINLQGGTKAWAISFFRFFQSRNNVSFILSDQENCVWDIATGSQSVESITMQKTFSLMNQTPKGYLNFGSYSKEDSDVAERLLDLYNKYQNSFLNITSDIAGPILYRGKKNKLTRHIKNYDAGEIPILNYGSIRWEKPSFLKLSFSDGKSYEFKSDNAVRLGINTGWFEFLVARLLSEWRGAREIRCNCVMEAKSGREKGRKMPLNEFDVIVYNGTKLIFVECKTGLSNSSDIDKFARGARLYGGTAAKTLLVTYQPIDEIVQGEKLRLNHVNYFRYGDDCNKLFTMLDKFVVDMNSM